MHSAKNVLGKQVAILLNLILIYFMTALVHMGEERSNWELWHACRGRGCHVLLKI